jgi:hypothetical protein
MNITTVMVLVQQGLEFDNTRKPSVKLELNLNSIFSTQQSAKFYL